MADNAKLTGALACAAKGWKVLPLHTPTADGKCSCGGSGCELDPETGRYKGKHPRTANGVDDATKDPAIIRQWWGRWPDANLGLATGEASEGALVLDFDKAELYPEWCASVNGLSERLTVQETGRGYQVILRCDKPGSNQKLAKDENGETLIETRATGGYIMAAPSLHPNGKTYKVIQGSLTAVPVLGMGDVDQLILAARKFHQTPKAPPDPWGEPRTLREAYTLRPPREYLVQGLIKPGDLGMVYGDSGTLKSFYLADLCIDDAAGLPHLPALPGHSGEPLTVTQAPVMWIDFDNGSRRTDERFEALGRARNLPADVPLYYYCLPNPWLDGGDSGAIGALAARMVARGIRLLAVDNLGLVSGDTDENSADMTRVMGGFRWLAEDTGAAVVLVHHQNKPNGIARKAGDTLRGSSAIKASLDLAVLIEREEGTNVINLKAAKSRDGDIPPWAAFFTFEHKPGSDELASARFFRAEPTDKKREARDDLKGKILAALADGPKNTTEVIDAVGGRYHEVLEALGELVLAKMVRREPGARGAKVYILTA